LTADNAFLLQSGKVARIDNGGALLMRAQKGRKEYAHLMTPGEIESFFPGAPISNTGYNALADAAGYKGVRDFHPEFVKQVAKISELRARHGGWGYFVEAHAPGLAHEDHLTIVTMLETRTRKLEERALQGRSAGERWWEEVLAADNGCNSCNGARTTGTQRDLENIYFQEDAIPAFRTSADDVLWRGDSRTPEEIQAAGGFHPFAPANPISVNDHLPSNRPVSHWVSSSTDLKRAKSFARGAENPFGKGYQDVGYVYKIRKEGGVITHSYESEVAFSEPVAWHNVEQYGRYDQYTDTVDWIRNPNFRP
jgi:hypothetical protein